MKLPVNIIHVELVPLYIWHTISSLSAHALKPSGGLCNEQKEGKDSLLQLVVTPFSVSDHSTRSICSNTI